MNHVILSVFCASLILTSCSGSHDGGPSGPPVETRTFVSDGNGSIQFYTNDPAHVYSGYFHIYTSSFSSPMSTVEVKVKKVTGNSGGGYGIVFCSADTNNFYRLVVTTSGQYHISKKVAGTYSTIIDWTHTDWWTDGYDIHNTILLYKSGADTFDLYVNNNHVTSFTDAAFDGGSAGFYALVSPNEDFPATAVDVRFQMLQPLSIP